VNERDCSCRTFGQHFRHARLDAAVKAGLFALLAGWSGVKRVFECEDASGNPDEYTRRVIARVLEIPLSEVESWMT
jgi:hypothetical protein